MYAKIKDGQLVQFPYGFGEFKEDNPYTNYGPDGDIETLFPQSDLATVHGYELVKVFAGEAPSVDSRTHIVDSLPPSLIDGQWEITWAVREKTEEEKQEYYNSFAFFVRQQRNSKLAECDWTQLADSTADKAAWGTYRQALRDVPSQAGFPWTIEWPTQP